MSLVRRSSLAPRAFLDDLPDRLRQMFDGSLTFEPLAEPVGWMPAMEILEEDDRLIVTAELPGMGPKDIEIKLEDSVLRITGEKKEEKKELDASSRYHMWERRYGSFHRAFTLPQSVDAEKISANFQDGVLAIDLPKSEKAKVQGRKIPIGIKK